MLIKRIDKTKAEVKLYGNIGGWFASGDTMTEILDSLENDGCQEVTFRFHTYGGSVFEGNVIANAFSRSKMKIMIVIDGIAASMGCMILTSVPAENIAIAENGLGMIHRPSSTQGGDYQDHLSMAKLLMDLQGNFIKTLASRTGKSAEDIQKMYFDGKDHWLNADEMIACKLAGRKVSTVASIKALDKQRLENMTEEGAYNHFAALAGSDIPQNNKSDLQMKKSLIEAFQLQGLTAESSDTAVLTALQAKFQATEDRLAGLETKAKAEKAASIKAALDTAEAAGKITAETRPTYEGIGVASGIDVLNTVLAGIGGKKPIVQQIVGGKGSSSPVTGEKTWAWYQEHDPKALESMPVSDPDAFRTLYKAEYGAEPEL